MADKKDLLDVVKKLKGKEQVDRPVFRLSKPGQNNPLKTSAGAESAFAKEHNQSQPVESSQAPLDGEDEMRAKHLMKIKGLAESGLPAKRNTEFDSSKVVLDKFKEKERLKEQFRNDEGRFKTVFPEARAERTKRDVMFEHQMTEDEAIEFLVRDDEFAGGSAGTSKILDQVLKRRGWKPAYDQDGDLIGWDDPHYKGED